MAKFATSYLKSITLCIILCSCLIETQVNALLYQPVPLLSRVNRQLQTSSPTLSATYGFNSSSNFMNNPRQLTSTNNRQQQHASFITPARDTNEPYQHQHYDEIPSTLTDSFGCPLECHCNTIAQIADCSNRNLTRVPTSFPREIKRIRLERNNITEIGPYAFRGLKRLQRIDLSNNNLQRIDALAFSDGLQSLNSLILYSNKLEQLPVNLFSELSQLQLLLLNANSLHTIHKDLFQTLANLNLLSLYDNNIETLPSGAFDGLKSIKTIHLGKNPLNCDCNLRWLADYLELNPVETSEARCETTWNARSHGKKLSQLSKAEFKCTEPADSTLAQVGGNKGQQQQQQQQQAQVDPNGCPVGCQCSGSTVDCSRSGWASSQEQRAVGGNSNPAATGDLYELPDVPDDVPVYVARVHINDPRIKRIRQTGLFRRLANSQKLDLGNNRIIDIEDNAINGQFSNGQKPERVVFVLLENQHCTGVPSGPQLDTDPCFSAPKVNDPHFDSPCYNGGSCKSQNSSQSSSLNYTCMCPPGFAGPLCEINIDDCVDHQCQNGAACLDGVNSYKCLCRDPTTSGEFCEQLAATSSAAPTLSFPYTTGGTSPLVAPPLALPIISTGSQSSSQSINNELVHSPSSYYQQQQQQSGQQILARSADFSRAPSSVGLQQQAQISNEQQQANELESQAPTMIGSGACQRLTQRKYYEDGNGCQSVRLLKLSTCAGSCTSGNCCQPARIKRRRVRMQCSDGASYVKTIDLIKKCSCSTGDCSAPNLSSLIRTSQERAPILGADQDNNEHQIDKSSSSQYFKYLSSSQATAATAASAAAPVQQRRSSTPSSYYSASHFSGPISSSQSHEETMMMHVDAVD